MNISKLILLLLVSLNIVVFFNLRCQCSNGKDVKSDGLSCDWKNYFYIGSENALLIGDINIQHNIVVDGTVTAVASDYSTNTIFFATEYNNGSKLEYYIKGYNPLLQFRIILDRK